MVIKKRILLTVIIIFTVSSVYASGKKDVTLEEIDILIQKKDLNEAVDKLDDYIKYNSTDFDNAQKRVETILKTREKYKGIADSLVELQEFLKENPAENTAENNKKILDYINELENMENNQNVQQQKFILNLKSAAQFIYNNSVFENLMTSGASFISKGSYATAAKNYTEGFTLYRDEFYDSGYDQEVVDTIDIYLKQLTTNLNTFENMQIDLLSVFERYNFALDSGFFVEAKTIFSEVDSQIKKLAVIRNQTAIAGTYLQNAFENLKETTDIEITDSSFLPFAYRFILGKDSDVSTGILAAIDTQWKNLVEDSKKHMYDALQSEYVSVADSIPTESLEKTVQITPSVITQFSDVSGVLELAKELNFLYLNFNESPRGYTEDAFPVYTENLVYGNDLEDLYTDLLTANTTFSTTTNAYKSVPIPSDVTSAFRDFENTYTATNLEYLSTIATLQDETERIFASITEKRTVQNEKGTIEKDEVPWDVLYTSSNSLYNTIQEQLNAMKLTSWGNLAQYVVTGCVDISNSYTETLQKGNSLINEPLLPIVLSRPDSALEILTNAFSSAKIDLVLLQNARTLLFSNSIEVLNVLSVPSQKVDDSILALENFIQNAPVQIRLAKERISLAQRAQNEAALRYSQTVTYMENDDFDRARDALSRSREKYSESLLYLDSDTLRIESDSKLKEIGEEITRLENEMVVHIVRTLKTQAKEDYYQGNFEDAGTKLVEARSTWSTTNVDSDAEIENLLALVKTAIEMKTGRVIYPTDPLYPEMSQILNIANQYYNEGYDLIMNGKREDALAELQNAKLKLQQLQIVYPLNQRASLLTLRIDKLINPDSFMNYFEQKYTAAKTNFDNNNERQQSYIDLLDLYEINSSYPGLKNEIYQAEITLKIRTLPPNKTAINNSIKLTKEAQILYNNNRTDEIILNQAIAKLDTAIELDGDNEDAAILKDRINTALGGQAIVVLPSAQQVIYQQAIQELQKGNILEAASLVSELWKDPDMQRSPDVIDLKNKVDLQL